ncbi:uncharacterized protein [Euwallacea similis]|uniref:uncharacterized protein n=1 Tax=Euwallacea similis TaxID=1736056 RepID=UPI00344D0212
MALEGYTIKDIEKVITGINGKKAIQVDIARLTAPGENYISLVFGVDILVEDEEGTRETIKAVAKRLPLADMKDGMSVMSMKNEIKFYSDLVPLLTEFAAKYGIATDYYPRYLGSRLSLDSEKTEPDSESVLLIENLLPQGYFNEDRFTGFDLAAAKAILKALAQFHGIPLAIKFKNPELFEVVKQMLDRSPFPEPPEDGPHEDAGPPDKLMFESILKIPAFEPYVGNIQKLRENLPPAEERFGRKGKEPWNTLSHNDFWINNMLIKVPGEDSSKHMVKLLDFQMCSYSPYAKDLVFFLLTSVRDDVQRKHFDDLLRYYYKELTALLTKIDVPELKLSYEEYMEEIKLVATKFEISHSLFFCNIIFAAKESLKDHLTGEVDVFDQINSMMSNLGERQIEKIELVLKLCVEKGWILRLESSESNLKNSCAIPWSPPAYQVQKSKTLWRIKKLLNRPTFPEPPKGGPHRPPEDDPPLPPPGGPPGLPLGFITEFHSSVTLITKMSSLTEYKIKDIEKLIGDGKKVVKIDIKRLTAPGENYLSLVFRVDASVENERGEIETINAVAKRLPLTEKNVDFNALAMRNEIKWYSEIVPLLTEFAQEYGIETDHYVNYLGSRFSLDSSKSEADSEAVLLLENLIPQGYVNLERHKGFDLETSKAILKVLAKFHAIPLASKFKKPELFALIRDYLQKTVPNFGQGEGNQTGAAPSEKLILAKALEIPACAPYVQNIKALQKNFVPMSERFKATGKEPWNTIVHNDFWVNNMMIKANEQERSKSLIKILDFQICLYTSYTWDVVFFMLTSLQDEVLKQHLDDLIKYYYEEFTGLLDKFDIPELKLSYDDYLEDLKHAATKYEVMHALFFCNVIFAPKGSKVDHLTGEVDMFEHMITMINNLGERSKEKISLVVGECVKRGWM